jgi:hypothetical protein
MKFLILYRSPMSAEQRMKQASPDQMKGSMQEWMDWKSRNEDAVIDFGMPLKGDKYIAGGVVKDSDSDIRGFTLIQADSVDAAVELLKDHPHFKNPNAPAMELLEFLPMPGM